MKATNLNLEVRPSDYKGFIMDSFIKDNPGFSADNLAQMASRSASAASMTRRTWRS